MESRELVHQLGVENSQHSMSGREASFYSSSPSHNLTGGTHSHHRHVRGALVVTGLAMGGALGIGGCEAFVCSDLVKASTHQALGGHEAELKVGAGDSPVSKKYCCSPSVNRSLEIAVGTPGISFGSSKSVRDQYRPKSTHLPGLGVAGSSDNATRTQIQSTASAGSSSAVTCYSRSSAGDKSASGSSGPQPLLQNTSTLCAFPSTARPPNSPPSSASPNWNLHVRHILILFDVATSNDPLVQLALQLNTAAAVGPEGCFDFLRDRLKLFRQAGCFVKEAQRVLKGRSGVKPYVSYKDFRQALVDIADGKCSEVTSTKARDFAAKVKRRVFAARFKYRFTSTEGEFWKLLKNFYRSPNADQLCEDAKRLVAFLDYKPEVQRYFCVKASELEKELKEKKHETSRTLLQDVARYAAHMLLTSTDGDRRMRAEGLADLTELIA